GGALVRAMLAQTPHATVAGAVAVDPIEEVRTRQPLCPGAHSSKSARGFTYGAVRSLPGFLSVGFSGKANPPGRDSIHRAIAQGEPAAIESKDPVPAENGSMLLARLVEKHLSASPTSALASSLVEMT